MTTDTVHAIDRSISHDEIVTIDFDAALVAELKQLADDWTDAAPALAIECWGTRDGAEWRVHVRAEVV